MTRRASPSLSGHASPLGSFVVTVTAFAVAVGVNTASVALEQRDGFATRRFGPMAWGVHLAVITPGWAWFLLMLRGLRRRAAWPLPSQVRPYGIPLLVLASTAWLWAFLQLGPVRTLNGGVFGRGSASPVRGGIFRWLRNPMYDSYTIALAGTGLRRADALYLVLAAEAFLLLNLIEGPIENRSAGSAARRPPSR